MAATGAVAGTLVPENWLGDAPVIEGATDAGTFDVVVLGGGHAGIQAALAAAENGASVAVVETMDAENYACFGDDFCCYNSQFMIEKGYGPYNTGDIVSEYVRRGSARVSPQIIRHFVENAGECFDHIREIALRNHPDTSLYSDGQYIIQHAYGKEKGSDYPISDGGYLAWASTFQTVGTTMTNEVTVDGVTRTGISRLAEMDLYCVEEAESKGAQWFWGHTACGLIQDGDKVSGAYAQDANGDYIQLNANKAVVLATGDFSGNADMVYNLLDDVNEWNVRIGRIGSEMTGFGRDGMGHKLGCWAGGALEPHPRPSMNSSSVPGPFGTVPMLWLNSKGERFMNEGMGVNLWVQINRQPLGNVCVVADKNYFKTIENVGIDHGAPNWGAPSQMSALKEALDALPVTGPEGGNVPTLAIINVSMGSIIDGYVAPETSGEEQESTSLAPPGMDGANVWKADTLEELLGYFGYEGETLKTALASIERYNELCEKGVDDDYGKDVEVMIPVKEAPFVGAFSANTGESSAGLVTLAGLFTDENFNVQKADRSGLIEGLYAVGNCLGQRYGVIYNTPSAGNSMGMAYTHGRVCGKIVAGL